MDTEELFTCLVLGDSGCGKSAFIETLINTPVHDYKVLPNCIQYISVFKFQNKRVTVRLLEVPGYIKDERRILTYQMDVDAILLCFAVDRPWALDYVYDHWVEEFKEHVAGHVKVLAGMKTDLRTDEDTCRQLAKYRMAPVSLAQAQDLADEMDFDDYIECSAFERLGVESVIWSVLQAYSV